MKNILVPTDFSKQSRYASEAAADIARRSGAAIHLVYVVDFPLHDPNFTKEAEEDIPAGLFIAKKIKERLQKYRERDYFDGVEVVTHIKESDNIYGSIIELSNEINADLIVMGSHSRTLLNKYLIGSNTDRVIRLANSPVLSVKEETEKFEIKNIAFASNFYSESYTVFEKLMAVAKVFDANIHLVKIITPVHFEPTYVSRRLIEDFVAKFGLSKYSVNIYNDEKVESGINRFAHEIEADVVAMETHGGSSIVQLISGSISEGVLEKTDLPVLTIKIKDEPVSNRGIFPELR